MGVFAFQWVRRPSSTPAVRGWRLAENYGCFACHGPGATRSTPAPGLKDGEIPQWDQGMHMMYIEQEEDIASWILYGHPTGKKHPPPSSVDARGPTKLTWPDGRIPMPAYREVLREGELSDLIAFYKAVAWYDPRMSAAAQRGRATAQSKGCFGCHGPSGQGAYPNPGSFKGYIPPWDGEDFLELVRDEKELRDWILEGKIGRFEENPAARFFLERQKVKMPAYRGLVSEKELDDILAYIQYLRRMENLPGNSGT